MGDWKRRRGRKQHDKQEEITERAQDEQETGLGECSECPPQDSMMPTPLVEQALRDSPSSVVEPVGTPLRAEADEFKPRDAEDDDDASTVVAVEEVAQVETRVATSSASSPIMLDLLPHNPRMSFILNTSWANQLQQIEEGTMVIPREEHDMTWMLVGFSPQTGEYNLTEHEWNVEQHIPDSIRQKATLIHSQCQQAAGCAQSISIQLPGLATAIHGQVNHPPHLSLSLCHEHTPITHFASPAWPLQPRPSWPFSQGG